jgi:uncharacterized membrane protein YeaQ/YmgE (transglycosylase-associated protein family)
MDVADLLVALVGGAAVGLLGKSLAPSGRDQIPLWMTVVCGIGGVVVGTYLYTRMFTTTNAGVDWWRHAWQVAVAAMFVALAATLVGRHRV